MAQEQHGHSKVAWTDTDLARAGEHEDLSGSFGGEVWLRATQEQKSHVWKPLKRGEPNQGLTSLVWFSATFPQKGLSRKDGPEFSPERYISRVDLAVKP